MEEKLNMVEEKLNTVIEVLLQYMKSSPTYHGGKEFVEQLIEQLEELQ